jgi:DNA-binding protein WhiA
MFSGGITVSFSSEVKGELSRFEEPHGCCRKSGLAGILRAGLHLKIIDGLPHLVFISENAPLSRHVFTLVKEFYHNGPQVKMLKTHRFRDHAVYRLDVSSLALETEKKGLLHDIGVTINLAESKLEYSPNVFQHKCCKRAYIRGCFLSTGSISDPDRSYHLEVSFLDSMLKDEFRSYLEVYGLKPREIVRKGHYLVYMKEGQDIVDFLNVTGAHMALMKLENIRILKDMRNQVNRLVNCETANVDKTVNASCRQNNQILFLHEHVGLETLPAGLKEVAELRLENSDMPLLELGQRLKPPLSKSGVNHRLRKLEKLAEEARERLKM